MPPLSSGNEAALRKMADEIGKAISPDRMKADDAREQADHQQRAEHEFEACRRPRYSDEHFDLVEQRYHREFEDLGDAVLKQQQSGDEAEEAEDGGLARGEQLVEPVHGLPPQAFFMVASTLQGPPPAVDR